MKQVPKEIIKWTNLKINKWNNAIKVFVEEPDTIKRKIDIKVVFKNKKG